MKILFLTSNLKNIGGIEQYNRNLIQIITELGEKLLRIKRQ